MPLYDHKKLRRHFEAARKDDRRATAFYSDLQQGLEEGHIKPSEFSVRQLFENFVFDASGAPCGHELVETWNPNNGGGVNLLEDVANAVSTANFSNITGQIIYTRMKEAFADPKFIGDQLVEVIPTQFNGERIPGIGRIADSSEQVQEGGAYPLAGVSEEWIDTPQTTKRGFIVPVTKEAVFFDRTGWVLKRASETAYWLGLNREKRILDAVFGVTNAYRYNGVSYNTYQTSSPWINVQTGNALADWTNVANAEYLFDAMTDPITGEPIGIIPDTIVVPTKLKYIARRALHGSQIRYGDGASSTNATYAPNPMDESLFRDGAASNYRILSSPLVSHRQGNSTSWWVGAPKKGFAYMENWPITVQMAPPSSEVEFTNDIVARYKVSERGVVTTLEPRYMVKNTP